MTPNEWADYWCYQIGVNVLPADSNKKRPSVHWQQYQNKPVPMEMHEHWKRHNKFANGISIIVGKVWHRKDKEGLYFTFIDADKKTAIDELCTRNGKTITLQAMAEKFIIEQHEDDPSSAHIYFYSRVPFPQKPADDAIGLEVKGLGEHGTANCTPSIHKNGKPWRFIGTNEPITLEQDTANEFIVHLDKICKMHNLKYLEKHYKKLLDSNDKIHEGARHASLLSIANSLLFRYAAGNGLNSTGDGIEPTLEQQLKQKLVQINEDRCSPNPLPDSELEQIWNDAVKFYLSQPKEHRNYNANNANNANANNYDDMPGCISYQLSAIPDKWIVGTPDYKLVELTHKQTEKTDAAGQKYFQRYVQTNKVFTACKPVKIIKHKNPLSFLELQQRYTIKFEGLEPSGNFTAKQKTLSEIANELKNGNTLSDNGVENALNAQVKGFEKAGLLEVNDDLSYTGFFTNEGNTQIIPSGVELEDIDIPKLKDALEYISELSKIGYANRLDLLAHLILFGLIAPCSFIFKVIKAQRIEWPQFYGKPNTTKSSSGRVVLGIDGHEDDDDYNVNMAHVDTIARFGDTISTTTFTKLVDEMDFTDNLELTNTVKSAVDQSRLRKVLNRSRAKEYIPALSAFIMTSNPSPPLHDGAFMKRVRTRYFGDSEVHAKDSEVAKRFDALLADLYKLHELGKFRNQYVMNNQQTILDKTLLPIQKARLIAKAVYEYAGMQIPEWLLTKQLEQTHLEESMIDAKDAVYNAFHNMLIDKTRLLGVNKLTELKTQADRFDELLVRQMLPFIGPVRMQGSGYIDETKRSINSGILKELYQYGITKEQLPNLKALAEYMGANYHRSDGKTSITITNDQLKGYLLGDYSPLKQVQK